MDQTIIDDFKQFITVTISQQLTQQTVEIRGDIAVLDQKITSLDQKVDKKTNEIVTAIGDTFAVNIDTTDRQLQNHEQRITKLETKTP